MFNLKNLDDATEFTLTFLLILCTLCCVHRSCTANHLFLWKISTVVPPQPATSSLGVCSTAVLVHCSIVHLFLVSDELDNIGRYEEVLRELDLQDPKILEPRKRFQRFWKDNSNRVTKDKSADHSDYYINIL